MTNLHYCLIIPIYKSQSKDGFSSHDPSTLAKSVEGWLNIDKMHLDQFVKAKIRFCNTQIEFCILTDYS